MLYCSKLTGQNNIDDKDNITKKERREQETTPRTLVYNRKPCRHYTERNVYQKEFLFHTC